MCRKIARKWKQKEAAAEAAAAAEEEAPLPQLLVTLTGRTGRHAGLMGTYERAEDRIINGSPLFTKMLAGGGGHFLYRSSTEGTWLVTDAESRIANNKGLISSSTAAALPTEAGLVWQYSYGQQRRWQDDANMRCIEGELPAPSMVTMVGHTGINYAALMGTYERSTERRVNGSPLFVKMLASGGGHFIYRESESGYWMATCEESTIALNHCGIKSSTAAALPTEAGLAWQWYDREDCVAG